jgi:hypothetical protein
MKAASLLKVAPVALLTCCVASCGNGGKDARQQPAVSYASREPGSAAVPTNDASFQLLEQEPSARLASLQFLVGQSGRHCNAVTAGVFEGGLDGTDLWTVKCSDTGEWHLWFRPYGTPDIAHCPSARCS